MSHFGWLREHKSQFPDDLSKDEAEFVNQHLFADHLPEKLLLPKGKTDQLHEVDNLFATEASRSTNPKP